MTHTVEWEDGAYVIYTEGGVRVGKKWANKYRAEIAAEKLDREMNHKERTCLAYDCQTVFMSEGFGNRLCDKCRAKTAGMD